MTRGAANSGTSETSETSGTRNYVFHIPPPSAAVVRQQMEARLAEDVASGNYSGERDAYRLRLMEQREPVADPAEIERAREYNRRRRRRNPKVYRCASQHCMGWHLSPNARCSF